MTNQMDLFEWAAIESCNKGECFCWFTIEKTGSACSTCRLKQLSDFNYVSNMLGVVDE